MSDIFFPRIFVRKQKLGAASSVSMTTYFHIDGKTLISLGKGPILAAARGQGFYKGYFDQTAELWSDDGNLLATGNQMTYFKD
jgi:hypothetical protein